MENEMNKTLTYILIIITTIFFISCTAEKDKGNNLSGKVLIDGQPTGGVLVRLYEFPELNDTLVNLQSTYPNIGVKITRELNFDKNALSVMQEVYTDNNGNWELDNLEPGNFVLVYNKDGLCKNQYSVNVTEGSSSAGNFDFGKVFIYANDSTITGTVTWPANSVVYIQGNVTLDDFSALYVGPGVNISFSDSTNNSPKGSLNIYGKAEFVGAENNFISLSGSGNLLNAWNRIKVGEQADGKFRYCIFSNGYSALSYVKAKLDVENCIFKNNKTGLAFDVNRKGIVRKISFMNNFRGLYGIFLDSISYENNLFYKNITGIDFLSPANFLISNSLIFNNNTGIENNQLCMGIIRNCEFQNNVNSVYLSNNSVKVELCNFRNSSNTDLYLYTGNSYLCTSTNVINQNNFFSLNFNIYNKGYIWIIPPQDINAIDNYWNGLTDLSEIADKIFDKEDAGINAQNTCNVLFTPFSQYEFTNAGIVNQ